MQEKESGDGVFVRMEMMLIRALAYATRRETRSPLKHTEEVFVSCFPMVAISFMIGWRPLS